MLKLCLALYVFCFCSEPARLLYVNYLLDCERQFVVRGGWLAGWLAGWLGRCLGGWLDDKVAGLLAEWLGGWPRCLADWRAR